MSKIFDLNGKIAVVTGGVSHLGLAMSTALADYGAEVVLISRNEENLKKAYDTNPRFSYFKCDVTKEEELESTIDKIIEKYGKIDILVNNAYSGDRKKIEDLDKKSWDEAMEKALTVYYLPIKVVSKHMLKRNSGSIINIASLFSYLAPDQRMFLDLNNNVSIHYAVAKGGILQMTRYLAVLWANKGIRVNAISPGFFPKKKGHDRLDYMNAMCSRIPMSRIGQPNELAGTIVLLASDASSYMTGSNIIVDGGYSIW
jgi:gluconate 5-dehydrogenase